MLSFSNLAPALAAPCKLKPVCKGFGIPESKFARVVHGLWMGLDDTGWVPEFNSENLGQPPIEHPDLQQRISELNHLPAWRAGSGQINHQAHFTRVLGEARILAQDLFSMWGDSDALALLELTGPAMILKAYDKGDDFAISACATAYTLIQADHAVRARLGSVVADEMAAVDALSKIHFSNYSKPVSSVAVKNSVPDTVPTSITYNVVGNPELHVQLNHPELKSTALLTAVLRLYENKRALASFGVEDLANLLNEPLSEQHIASYFTLVDGPFHHVCNSIEAIPEPVFLSFEWRDGKHAFEQCCRYFGEEFMLQTTFGQHPSTTHQTLFNQRLMKILPVLQRFLQGDESSWC